MKPHMQWYKPRWDWWIIGGSVRKWDDLDIEIYLGPYTFNISWEENND